MARFKQESATTGTYLPNGHRITLDFILDDTQDGYLSSDNGYVVNQIRQAIATRSGGWVEISEAEYEEALKKKVNPPSHIRNRRKLNAGMLQQSLRASPVDSVAAVVSKPDPITVPKPEQMKLPARPMVGKLNM